MSRFASLVLLCVFASACGSDDDVFPSTSTEPTLSFDVVFPSVDTDWPLGLNEEDTDVVDTDIVDTDIVDTDIVDTDIIDTDIGDTDIGDTDGG